MKNKCVFWLLGFFSPQTAAKLSTGLPVCFLLQVLFLYRQAKYIPSVVKNYFSVCIFFAD